MSTCDCHVPDWDEEETIRLEDDDFCACGEDDLSENLTMYISVPAFMAPRKITVRFEE